MNKETKMLNIENLSVVFDKKTLLSDVNFSVIDGALHLLSGVNGSGKTTLIQTIAGNPEYALKTGSIIFDGNDISNENATTRSLLGIFTGSQNVPEIPGLSVMSFLKHSMSAHTHFQTQKQLSAGLFFQKLAVAREKLDIPEEWMTRSINVGFSGGERKRLMFLRLLLTEPKLAMLDEPDSGADIGTKELFADIINDMNKNGTTFLVISHQRDFQEKINISAKTVLKDGKIVIQ